MTSLKRPNRPDGTDSSCGSRCGASTPGSRSASPRSARHGSGSARCSRHRRGAGPGSSPARSPPSTDCRAGRVTLSVGLGALDSGFDGLRRGVRQDGSGPELMDECLDIMCGLWAGQPFAYRRHALQRRTDRVPDDRPHGPAAAGPDLVCRCASGGRSRWLARIEWDGVIPQVHRRRRECASRTSTRPPQLRDEIATQLGDRPFDIVIEGAMADHSPAAFAERRRHLVDRVDVGRDERTLPGHRRPRPAATRPARALTLHSRSRSVRRLDRDRCATGPGTPSGRSDRFDRCEQPRSRNKRHRLELCRSVGDRGGADP